MTLARVKVWNPGDVLTALDLNAEFNNILNNPTTLISPFTANIDVGNFQLVRARLENVTTTQAAAQIGRAMFNTSDNMVNIDDGSFIRRIPTLISTQMLAGDLITTTTDTQPTFKLMHSSQMVGPVAAAWVVFNGLLVTTSAASTGGFLMGYGVNSSVGATPLLKNSTGDYTITWANQFSTQSYLVMGLAAAFPAFNPMVVQVTSSGNSTSAARITTKSGSGGAADPNYVSLMAFTI